MITDLRLQNFRSYSDDSFEFSPSVNIVVGPNASGKTNLLEALLVVGRGSSYRAKDAELVAFEKPWARLEAHTQNGGERSVKLVGGEQPGKSFDIDGKPYRRLTMAHSLPVVLFEPNHLQLLSGGPERRRTYLDDLLEQTVSGYSTLRRQYNRTLAQRNALLKQHSNHTEFFPWDVRLSELAGQIVRFRASLVADMAAALPKLYKSLSGTNTKAAIVYSSQWPADGYESHMLKKLAASAELDSLRGFTAAGPHREDFAVLFDGHPAAAAASRGEARTLVLALKILELQTVEAARDAAPLLLLDDVFSELDGSRRRALTTYLKDYQTFITTTDADVVLQNFTETTHIIPLSAL